MANISEDFVIKTAEKIISLRPPIKRRLLLEKRSKEKFLTLQEFWEYLKKEANV
jgi:hypothetical protein